MNAAGEGRRQWWHEVGAAALFGCDDRLPAGAGVTTQGEYRHPGVVAWRDQVRLVGPDAQRGRTDVAPPRGRRPTPSAGEREHQIKCVEHSCSVVAGSDRSAVPDPDSGQTGVPRLVPGG